MKFSAAGPIREACVILGLTVVGAVPRLAGTEGLGLSHFDEGVYAMAGFWVTTSRGLASIPPRVIPFAPPGLPILVGMAYLMLGFTDKAAIAVAQATGILTVPVLGWLGRRTFGPGAGAASAAVAAVAGSHVAFSRMALTDVPFLLIWLIAIGLGARFLERPRAGSAVTLGLAIGVAQNFKYNGWLLAVVVAVAAAIGFVRRRGPKREILKTVGFGLLATVVAFLIDLPWVRFVEANGGYRKLLAHHRSYVQGFGAWPRNWASQMRQSIALSGGPEWGAGAVLLATIAVGLVWFRLGLASRESFRSRTIVGFVTLAVALAFMPNLPWWVGLVMTPCLLGDERSRFRIVGVWWLLMSILTPLYHPYARLWLPLHAAGWLMMGALIAQALSGYVDGSLRSESPADPPRPLAVDTAGSTSGGRRDRRWGSKGLRRGSVGLTCVLLAFCFDRISPPHAHPSPRLLGPTNGLSNVVAIMSREEVVQDGLRILASPPLEFYLRLERVPLVLHRDVDQLLKPAPGLQWALVDEVILRQESDPDRARVRLFRQCEVVDEATWDLGLVAALDVDPGLAVRDSQPPRPHVWLLRPKPRKAD